MKYKVTLWKNYGFCKRWGSPEECCFTKVINADSKAEAAHIAIDPHVDPRSFKNKPSVYEIIEI